MKTTLMLVISLVVCGSSFAQPGVPPGQAKKSDAGPVVAPSVPDIATQRANIDDAKTLAKGRDVAAAEKKLMALNRAKADTPVWHLETAQRLVELADQLSREGADDSVAALAGRALQHLGQVETSATNANFRAAAKTMAGFIEERYLADPAAALMDYQSAAELAPTTATMAKEAADRLHRSDENLQVKAREPAR